jgi:hypothetical protein
MQSTTLISDAPPVLGARALSSGSEILRGLERHYLLSLWTTRELGRGHQSVVWIREPRRRSAQVSRSCRKSAR